MIIPFFMFVHGFKRIKIFCPFNIYQIFSHFKSWIVRTLARNFSLNVCSISWCIVSIQAKSLYFLLPNIFAYFLVKLVSLISLSIGSNLQLSMLFLQSIPKFVHKFIELSFNRSFCLLPSILIDCYKFFFERGLFKYIVFVNFNYDPSGPGH